MNMIDIMTNKYQILNLDEIATCNSKDIELDLGCGKGTFTIELAKCYPDKLIIAADIMIGRVKKVKYKVQKNKIENVLLMRASAIELLGGYQIPNSSISRIHLLCPDPWPKRSHRDKRLISSEFIGKIANALIDNGIFHFSTDDEQYLNFFLKSIKNIDFFTEYPEGISDIIEIKTDFERQWVECGRNVVHLSYKKVVM